MISLRQFLNQTQFQMAEVLGIEAERQHVNYLPIGEDRPQVATYDHLVIALGSVTRFPDVPGLSQFGFPLKGLADAVALRDRAIELLERAEAVDDVDARRALLHWVVVGGNFTGVEVAGEFEVFVRHAARHYPKIRRSDIKVSLVEIAPRILSVLDDDLADYATDQMRRRGMNVLLNTSVNQIHADYVQLSSGETITTHTVVWCAGIASNPLLRTSPFPVDSRGYVQSGRDLRVAGFDNVWAVGDCAVNLDIQGQAYPATAQHAVQQGIHLADNLSRVMRGQQALPFNYHAKGALAALGCRTGVAKVFGFKFSGLFAWLLWRSVYLMKMPGISRKLRVALDWTADLFFRRDYVQLGVHRGPDSQSANVARHSVAEQEDTID